MMTLPKCVHFKHGAYWMVKRGAWIRLTSKPEEVAAKAAEAERFYFHKPTDREAIRRYLVVSVARRRANAKGRGIHHELTTDDALALLDEAKWRRAVTCAPFSVEQIGPRNQRPYAPRIDRIDSSIGHVKSNCRRLCAAAGAKVHLTLDRHSPRWTMSKLRLQTFASA
jgi:hypothetical protein